MIEIVHVQSGSSVMTVTIRTTHWSAKHRREYVLNLRDIKYLRMI